MEGLNQLARYQEENGQELERLLRNMKKDSTDRKTERYLTDRQRQIEEIWKKVKQNNTKMTATGITEHSYFSTNYYEQIKDVYGEAVAYILEQKTKLVSELDGEEQLPAAIRERQIDPLRKQRVTTAREHRVNPDRENQIDREQSSPSLREQVIRVAELQDAIDEAEEDVQQSSVSSSKYEWHRKELDKQWEIISNNHISLRVNETTFDDSYFRDNVYQRIRSEYKEISERLAERSLEAKKQCRTYTKLPDIKIPYFDGKYEEWATFQDTFKRVIDTNSSLTEIEKMQYLKSYVKGEASKSIQHFNITEINYKSAWKHLQEMYENKRLTVSRLIGKIFEIPTLLTESAEKLKNIYNIVKECLEALKLSGVDTSSWDPIIIYIVTRRWDSRTNDLYETSIKNPMELQALDEVLLFMRARFQSLEAAVETQKKISSNNQNLRSMNFQQPRNNQSCNYCNLSNHAVYDCMKFKTLPNNEKYQHLKNKQLCFNCLTHTLDKKCMSQQKCRLCNRNHHTLLHKDTNSKYPRMEQHPPREETRKVNAHTIGVNNETSVLATALIKVKTAANSWEYLRALVDSGSQGAFITEEAAHLLGLPYQRHYADIVGIGVEKQKSQHKVSLQCRPRFTSQFVLDADAIVLPRITTSLPEKSLDVDMATWKNHMLADPVFYKTGPIDVLLGTRECSQIILQGLRKTKNGLMGQNTELGWIISGTFSSSNKNTNFRVVTMVSTKEHDDMSRFWELEEVPNEKPMSTSESACEKMYEETVSRNEDGRYTVRIPFNENKTLLGESRSRAMARLLQLEKRLAKDKTLETEYIKFMREYVDLGHMERLPISERNDGKYYIPHHAVMRESSTTTKLRVVFDASCKTTTGVSLNETMHVGPRIQQELFDIIVRWRTHKVVFKADVEKMYRQIMIAEQDQDYQRILWRFSPSQPVDEYKLKTVTYGTAAAPYLAVRTLQQLANDEKDNYPIAAMITKEDFYVDDILSGADSEMEAQTLQIALMEMFQQAGLTLRKWSSNSQVLIDNLPDDLRDEQEMEMAKEDIKKSLGLYWAPKPDVFVFKVDITKSQKMTKRTILSTVAKLFDPLGWLSPVVIKAKLIIQELWLEQLSWDEVIPKEYEERWRIFHDQLLTIEEIVIPRWIMKTQKSALELHGFADASEKAYGAVVYVKIKDEFGSIAVSLLAAKTKVAPVKSKTTLPRLELCAAHLLAKLLKRVSTALHLNCPSTYAWTDSMIALAWIKGDISRWKTFVSNRVSEVNRLIPESNWNHVKSEENPADVISRGMDPSKLQGYELWWKGPKWLHQGIGQPQWIRPIGDTTEEMKRHKIVAALQIQRQNEEATSARFSSLNRMRRVIAYCNRFADKARKKDINQGHLTVQELQRAEKQAVKEEQQMYLVQELKALQTGHQVHKQSKILNLTPFMDQDGILRVGGRLKHSLLSYGEKHPAIIASQSNLAKLIVREAHQATLHGGNQETLSYIRRKYWIVNAKRSVKSVINKCVKCIRYKAVTSEQLMGHLPAARVTATPAFTHTGIDYAGPIQVRATKGRGHKSYKGYLSIFVCLATKAIHIEVVSDLCSESFLAALKRFVSRRGMCRHIHSDNGTTFVGANTILEKEALRISQEASVQNECVNIGIQWHFIPPSAPHFGGLWEAGVKSVKHHLKRVIGETTLTYEELTTVTHQIEACLNSRPLCTSAEDINEFNILTPGHFLIGRELLAPPTVISEDFKVDLQGRWKLVQKMRNEFWRVWSKEYLHQMQQRYKWKTPKENLKVNDIVIIKDDISSPGKWPMGRVVQVHPDSQGVTRVVTIKRSGGVLMNRPIHKLLLLSQGNEQTAKNKNAEKDLKTKANRPKTLWNITMIAMLFLVSLNKVVAEPAYTIKYPLPGIYVEHIANARVERGTFRLEVKFERSLMANHTIAAQEITNNMTTLCEKTKDVSSYQTIDCHSLVANLQEKLHQLSWIEAGLNSSVQYRTLFPRQKRGLLGDALTSIFGVNDEVYRRIDDLNDNQRELISAANHQTKFMLQALSRFNDTESRIQQKIDQFQTKLNQGLEALETMQYWYNRIDHNSLSIHLLNTYEIANSYLDDLIRHYKSLLNIHVNQANFYDFISPAHIENIIKTSAKKLPSNIEIRAYPMVRTQVEHTQEFIHLYGYFPISEIGEFVLIKTTPIPHKVENGFYWTLDVTNDILAIDYNTQRYFVIKDEDLKRSTRVTKELYICSPHTIRSIENSPNCVIDEIYRRTENNSCPLRQSPIRSGIWKQLYTPNSWLFIFPEKTKVAITCSGQREDVKLNQTGIIYITQECVISTKDIVLTPRKMDGLPVVGSFVKPVVANLTLSKTSWFPPPPTHQEEVFQPFDTLKDLQTEEEDIQAELASQNWKTVAHHSILTSIITTSSISIIVVILIVGYKILKKRLVTAKKPEVEDDPEAGIELRPLREGEEIYATIR